MNAQLGVDVAKRANSATTERRGAKRFPRWYAPYPLRFDGFRAIRVIRLEGEIA